MPRDFPRKYRNIPKSSSTPVTMPHPKAYTSSRPMPATVRMRKHSTSRYKSPAITKAAMSQGPRGGPAFRFTFMEAPLPMALRAVIAVDFHVVVGQVAAVGLGALPAAMCRWMRISISSSRSTLEASSSEKGMPAPFWHTSTWPLAERKADVDLVHVHRRAGVADGAQHPAPVGVRAEHGRLEQSGADHAFGHGAGPCPQVAAPVHLADQQLGGALRRPRPSAWQRVRHTAVQGLRQKAS